VRAVALDRYLAEEIALDCAHGRLSRREALRRLGLLGVGATSAAALLAACGDDDASGTADDTTATSPAATSGATGDASTTAAAPDPTASEDVSFPGPNGDLLGVWSEAAEPRGAVLVIHENRGLTPDIRAIPPRLAADGYSTLAVDLLSEEGGTEAVGDEAAAFAALAAAGEDRLVADLHAAVDELERRAPGANLAVIGFCFGGGMTWALLDDGEPRLGAAVPFYGPAPAEPDFSGSNAAVLGIYAELDDRVNATRDAAEAALQRAGLTYELRTFPGVDHAFFNPARPTYDANASAEAYQAMLDWFDTHLA
jgi:carboxymethylenebutenolidase